jgi:hypothetical protein
MEKINLDNYESVFDAISDRERQYEKSKEIFANYVDPEHQRLIGKKVIEFVEINYPEDSKQSEEYQAYLNSVLDPRD